MKVIPREAGRVTYSTEIRKLKKLKLSDYQKQVIIGCILGDGCLSENWSKTNFRLQITQSINQKDYVFWKYSILRNLILSEPRYYFRNQSLTIRTISHKELTELRNIFYIQNKKIIPANIAKMLSPLILAVWFMDDGNVFKTQNYIHGYNLNTQSFTKQENQTIVNALKDNYDIECNIQKNNGYVRIFIRAQSRKKFVSLIEKYVIPSMRYKFG